MTDIQNHEELIVDTAKENQEESKTNKSSDTKITFSKVFILFIFGSLIGVVIEGVWCLIAKGHWETHVVSMWGDFCILYGFGAAGCYVGNAYLKNQKLIVKFLMYLVVGSVIEIICGALLEYGLGMRAWNYENSFLNFKGYTSLGMSVMWGVLGVTFGFLWPLYDKLMLKLQSKALDIVCGILSIFMLINISFALVCIFRWSERHNGEKPSNKIEKMIDKKYDDEFMKNRFMEWQFLDDLNKKD